MSNTKDRELEISREMDAPIDLVWEVWTNPEHIKSWWGPTGFTNTIHEMHVEPNGIWELTMHGPDGTDYHNKSVFREIVHHKRISYEHLSEPKFLTTVDFVEQGNKTLIKWHMLFESKEQFEEVVKKYGADEGLKQNLDKLKDYLIQFIA